MQDPEATPSSNWNSHPNWNDVCWDGTLAGQVNLVLKACDLALEQCIKEGNHWMAWDSRGLANALSSNIDVAIKNFEYFIENTDNINQNTLAVGLGE